MTVKLDRLDLVALILVVVGGINWGLVGLFGFDLVAVIFGELTLISRMIYTLVALSAIYTAVRSPHMAHMDQRHGAHPA